MAAEPPGKRSKVIARISRARHEMDVATRPQIETASDQVGFRATALDDQNRDIGPAPPQFVGDPREGEDPCLGRRVDEGQISLVLGLRSHSFPVDQTREDVGLDVPRGAKVLPWQIR